MNLVTGANGLVGSYLCRYLVQKGESVRALKREKSDLRLVADIVNKIEWVEGDVTDINSLEDAMQGIDHVYHAAAVISYVKKQRSHLMHINVEGTANMVNVALNSNIKKFLQVSSIAAIGKNSFNNDVYETNTWEKNKHTSDYSISKYLAEREVWRGIAEGLNAVIINPSVIIGAGNWDNGSSKLFKTVYSGFKFYTTGTTGYVDVRDVVQIAHTLMHSEISAERFILSSEDMVFRDYFYMIADALGKKRPSIKANAFLSSLAWRADAIKYIFTGKEPSVTKQTAYIANKTYHYHSDKIRSLLNYDFIPVHDSIQDTAEQFNAFIHTGKLGHVNFFHAK